MEPVTESLWFIDVRYRDCARLIACGVLETSVGLLLVDPGPAVVLDTLEHTLRAHGAGFDDVHGLLLTHIHLDHAGAAGLIVSKYPHVQVYVHVRGARHMIHPERLLASARRIYGAQMEAQWGPFLPVPKDNVYALEGGETLFPDVRALKVAYTPGHASHHVSYLDGLSGTAFVGDTAGMRVMGIPYVIPVAPPPDIHIGQWMASLDILREWDPARLLLTHFGPSGDVQWHLDSFAYRLDDWARQVQASLATDADDAIRAQAFHEKEIAVGQQALRGYNGRPYEEMGQPVASWYGLARYWRIREQERA